MMRTIQFCEKNVEALPPSVVTLAPATNVAVVADRTLLPDETAAITVQNVGSNNAYYNFEGTCDGTMNFHGLLQPGVMLSCPTTMAVNMFSPGGTTIAVTILVRIQGI
jgi:hypothetical protein